MKVNEIYQVVFAELYSGEYERAEMKFIGKEILNGKEVYIFETEDFQIFKTYDPDKFQEI